MILGTRRQLLILLFPCISAAMIGGRLRAKRVLELWVGKFCLRPCISTHHQLVSRCCFVRRTHRKARGRMYLSMLSSFCNFQLFRNSVDSFLVRRHRSTKRTTAQESSGTSQGSKNFGEQRGYLYRRGHDSPFLKITIYGTVTLA